MTHAVPTSPRLALAAAAPLILPLFVATTGLSAALLFVVQPMFAKMTLPLLGGAPGVWNTAMVFFQGMLLLGYLYAHGVVRVTRGRAQLLIHAGVLTIGAFGLPIAVSDLLGPPPAEAGSLWLLGLYAASVGAPFFAVAANAPLLQAWYAATGRPDASDPYHLYAASNAGSLVALLAYPVLIEPTLSLDVQGFAWAAGFALLATGLLACGAVAAFGPGAAHAAAAGTRPVETPATPRSARAIWGERLAWIAYAAVPSSLLLGVTTHITTDVASAPMLWVVPLALFLLTFIFAFGTKPAITPAAARRVFPIVAAAAALVITRAGAEWWSSMPLLLGAFFLAALVCHQELARRRPTAARLTEFYLWMSFGGVLGGAFTALLAPVVFETVLEYPLAFLAALLLRPASGEVPRARMLLACGIGVVGFALALGLATWLEDLRWSFFGMAATAGAAFLVVQSRFAFTGLLGLVLLSGLLVSPDARAVYIDRSFFGVHKVLLEDDHHVLVHGTTKHGVMPLDPELQGRPMSYYGPLTALGQAMTAYTDPARTRSVGVVGLGTGNMACFARPEQSWTFFEIDPAVVKIARDPALFNHLSVCKPEAAIVLGDARLTLANTPPGGFDLLVLDAFSSDMIPAHLMTQEAFALYAEKVAPSGVIVFHISNRILELEGPLADIAAEAGWVARAQLFVGGDDGAPFENQAGQAVILARSDADLGALATDPRWPVATRAQARVWSDDYVNIVGAMVAYLERRGGR